MRSSSPFWRPAAAVAALALVGLTGAACSSGDSSSSATTSATQAYCNDWAALATAFDGYAEVDLVNGGLDSVRAYVASIQTAADALKASSDSLITPKAEALVASMRDLATTLTDPSLPVDRRAQVQEASAEVDDAWNSLVDTARTTCPGVTASTIRG